MQQLYVSSRCPHSAELLAELRRRGEMQSYRVIDVDAVSRSMLPAAVTRVPLLVRDGAVLFDDALFDLVFAGGGAADPGAGGHMVFGGLSDLGAPLDGEAGAEPLRNFYDLQRPPDAIHTPPEEAVDAGSTFNLDQLKADRLRDAPS